MKILFATDDYYPHLSGPAIFVDRIVANLKKRGHSVCIIAPSKNYHYEAYIRNGIKVFGMPSIPVFFYEDLRFSPPFLIRKYVKKILVDFNPEVVHLQSHFIIVRTVLNVAKQLKIPIVGTNHFLPENILHYFHLPKFIGYYVNKIIWYKSCRFFDKLDILTTPTKTAAEIIKSHGFSKNILSISNGIDLKLFNPKNKGTYLKKRYNLPNKPILLYSGRIDKEKNIDMILKAFTLILKKIDAHLIIAGKGAYEKHLRELVNLLNLERFVSFVGFLSNEDLQNFYSIADCFIIASTAELQSIVTMEAMASGLPIVAANALALPELVINNKNGYLFEPGDIDSMSQYVINIITNKNLQKNMSRNSISFIKKHNIKNTISQFELLYKEVAKNH